MSNITNQTTQVSAASSSTAQIDNIVSFLYTFIIPVICIFGICTNIVNIIVFSSKELSDITYKYLRANAFANAFYLTNCFFIFMARCGIYCEFDTTFYSAFYLYLFYNYLKGIAAIFTISIQIIVSILRLMIVTNKKFCILPGFSVMIILLIIFSAIFYSPNLFTQQIVETKVLVSSNGTNGTSVYSYSYSTGNNSLGNSLLGKWLVIAVTIFRGFISLTIILSIDIFTSFKLKKHFTKKKAIKGVKSIIFNKKSHSFCFFQGYFV